MRHIVRRNKAKVTAIRDNITGKVYENCREAAKALGCNATTIRNYAKGLSKQPQLAINVSYVDTKNSPANLDSSRTA